MTTLQTGGGGDNKKYRHYWARNESNVTQCDALYNIWRAKLDTQRTNNQ